MKFTKFAIAPLAVVALAACDSGDEAEPSPADAIIAADAAEGGETGARVGALGMTEAQLLDADLVSSDGTDLGDVESVRRDADDAVESLVVELDGSDPERVVLLPINGLSTQRNEEDDGTDIVSQMSADELAALPDAADGRAPEASL